MEDEDKIIHGYEVISAWKNGQCGKTARAQKSGKSYFIKIYQNPVEPVMNGALDERTFNNNKAKFEKFVARRKRINETLRAIAGEGGNIIIPREEFLYNNHYVEVSELIDGAVSDDELESVLASLPLSVKKLLMLTAAGALVSVHGKNIVHSDLKLKNVLLAKNRSGNYVAKLIDFDSSYLLDDMPEILSGSLDYCSPELGMCASNEDECAELSKKLTCKSDIFSLGLIFHYYLAGELPQPKTLTERLQRRKDKGKDVYCWAVVNSGCELQLSDKITSLNYLSLIQDMLALDPAERPSAREVLQRLKAPEEACVIETAWPEHSIVIDADKVKRSGYVALKRIDKSGTKKYTLITSDGKKFYKTKEDMLSDGLAKAARETKFAEPWDEHEIVFNEEKLRSRGFVSSEKKEYLGTKGYEVFRDDDSSQFFTVAKLIAMGFAGKAAPHIEENFCKPWSEHKITFDKEQIKKRGFVRSEQKEFNGIKGYNFIKADGTEQFIRPEMLIVFKMAKKL